MRAVYVIESEIGNIKIGIANNPARRLADIRNASGLSLKLAHVELTNRASEIERAAHALLQDARVNGEWFRTSVENGIAAVRSAVTKISEPNQPLPAMAFGATEYRAALASLGLSQVGAAKLLRVGDRTSRRWAAGDEIPAAVAYLLRLMVKHKVKPGDLDKTFSE